MALTRILPGAARWRLCLMAPVLLLALRSHAADVVSPDEAAVAKDSNAFTAAMYAQLAKDAKGDLFFSPSSIHTALAMAYAGARGQTAAQMARALHYTLEPARLHPACGSLLRALNTARKDPAGDPAFALTVSNALWGQKGYLFKPDFIALNNACYGAGLKELDFAESDAARKTINDWVAQQTKEKIKDLIPLGVISSATRLVLTNAVYFKSNWAAKFEKAATKDGPFTTAAGRQITTPMMHQEDRFRYMETADLQALELPYRQYELSMVVLLPRKPDGLPALEQALSAGDLTQWLGQLRVVDVQVTMPRFKVESSFSLADNLKALGMTDAFNPDRADFSGIAAMERLFISAVIHKAYVAVDEEGTEAAAATAVVMDGADAAHERPQPKVFSADHPFIFLIRHRASGLLLFMGRLLEPAAR